MHICLDDELPLEPAYFQRWTIHELDLTTTLQLANLAHRRAIAYKITNELSTMSNYEIPRKYAAHFDQIRDKHGRRRFDGIRYRTRFDTGSTARGVAFFDDHGERAWGSTQIEVDDNIINQLRKLGIVTMPPKLVDLDRKAA
jgi:hypothetical protein